MFVVTVKSNPLTFKVVGLSKYKVRKYCIIHKVARERKDFENGNSMSCFSLGF